jgi:hypothetical protein
VVVIVWLLDLQLPLQSVPITINIVSSTHTQAENLEWSIVKLQDIGILDNFVSMYVQVEYTSR